MELRSSAFHNNQSIPKQYTCDGSDTNPPLEISGVPESARSLVLIVDDPDAPSGTFTHWTVWNISPETNKIAENSVPEGGMEGVTSFGKRGYGGPCPPPGTHRYYFKLYALNGILHLDSNADASQLEASMEGHIVDRAELIGLYGRE